MKRFFDEEVKTESRYNRFLSRMKKEQFTVCISCEYRTSSLQEDIKWEEYQKNGGNPRCYQTESFRVLSINCRKARCLIDGSLLVRVAAKAALFLPLKKP